MRGLLFRSLGALIGLSCLMATLSCARDQTLDWLEIKPQNVTLTGTPTIIYTAIGHYSHPAQERDLSSQVMWQTDTPSIIAFSDPSHPNYLIPTGLGCGTNLGVLAFVFRHPGNNQEVHGGSSVNVTCTSGSGSGGSGIDFTLVPNPGSQNLAPNGSVQFTINVNALSGAPTVQLSVNQNTLPAGLSASFNPTSVNASGSSVLTITASSTIAAGTYTVSILGTDSTGTGATSITVDVS
jgi:hypothetical protein